MSPEDLRELLEHAIAAAGVDVAEVAEHAGVSPQTVYRWLHGVGLRVAAGYLTAIEGCGFVVKVTRPRDRRIRDFENPVSRVER